MGFLDVNDIPGDKVEGRYEIRETLAKYVSLGAYNKYIIFDPENQEFTYHRKYLWGLFGEHVILKFDELSYINHTYKKEVHRDQDGHRRREEVYRVFLVSKIGTNYHISTFNNSSKSRAMVNTLQHYTGLGIGSPDY